MKKLIVLLLMILPLGAIAQEVKIAFVKLKEVFMLCRRYLVWKNKWQT